MVPCALQDVDDLDLLRMQAVKHQIFAMDAAANPVALVARHQSVGPGGVRRCGGISGHDGRPIGWVGS